VAWSPDGGTLVYRALQPHGQWNLWAFTAADRQRRALAPSAFDQMNARFSPNGRWLAYVSNETGRNELYVRPAGAGGDRWQISNLGARLAVWAASGRQLYYRDGADGMWVVDVADGHAFAASRARLLFRLPDVSPMFDVTADGKQFVMIKFGRLPPTTQLRLVLNPLSASADGGQTGQITP